MNKNASHTEFNLQIQESAIGKYRESKFSSGGGGEARLQV